MNSKEAYRDKRLTHLLPRMERQPQNTQTQSRIAEAICLESIFDNLGIDGLIASFQIVKKQPWRQSMRDISLRQKLKKRDDKLYFNLFKFSKIYG
jgi:hypothetical protein